MHLYNLKIIIIASQNPSANSSFEIANNNNANAINNEIVLKNDATNSIKLRK